MANTKNVAVRKKNKADKPTDLRREPMLRKDKERCQRGSINSFDARLSEREMNSQKQERDDHPGEEENSNSVFFHTRISLVCSGDARVGDEEASEREPECTIGCECYSGAKPIVSRLPTMKIIKKRAIRR